MDSKPKAAVHHETVPMPHRPRKRGVLPCGSRLCLRCHKGCGVAMAAYLGVLDELPAQPGDEDTDSQ
jgi:hypothetical protein